MIKLVLKHTLTSGRHTSRLAKPSLFLFFLTVFTGSFLPLTIYQPRAIAQQSPTPVVSPASAPASPQSLRDSGWQLFSEGTAESRQKSLQVLQSAADLFRQQDQPKEVAKCLQMIALVHFSLSQYSESINYYQQALSLYEQLNLGSDVAYLKTSIAMGYINLSQYPQAIKLLEESQSLFRQQNNPQGLANSLSQTAQVYYKMGATDKAISTLTQVLELQKAAGDSAAQVSTLQSLAIFYVSLGQLQQAEQVLNQAKILDPASASLVNQIAQVLGSRSRPEDVMPLEELYQLLATLKAAGDRGNMATILMSIGTIHTNRGDSRQGLEVYQEALALYQALKLKGGEASALTAIGENYQTLGDYQKSLDNFGQALKLAQESGNLSEEISVMLSLAGIYGDLGSYDVSLDYYKQALAVAQKTQNRFQQGQALTGSAYYYRLKRDYPNALASAEKALAIWQTEKQPLSQAVALSALARTYESLQNYPQALDAVKQIQAIAATHDDPWMKATANSLFARIYYASGQPQLGLTSAQQAVEQFKNMGQLVALAPSLDNLAKIYGGLQQTAPALETYEQALTAWQKLGDRLGEVNTRYEISRLYRNTGRLTEAKKQIEQALAMTEDLRNKVTSQDLRQSYFSTVQDYYEFYIDLLMELHQQSPTQKFDQLALEASERARARSLLELLGEAKTEIRQGIDPALGNEEKNLRENLNRLKVGRLKVLGDSKNAEQLASLDAQINQANQDYQRLLEKIRSQSPRYAALTQPKLLSLSDIQSQLLDEDTLILEYYLGKERSYLWLIGKNEIKSYFLPKKAEIEREVRRFHLALANDHRATSGQIQRSATSLSQSLLQAIAPQLGKKRLVIIADGALQYFPFAALPTPGSDAPLMVNHEIVYLPSVSTLAILRQQSLQRAKPSKTIAIFADPVFNQRDDRVKSAKTSPEVVAQARPLARAAQNLGIQWERLPGTREEAESIKAFVPASERTIALGFGANHAQVLQSDLTQYRFIHFATHGVANTEQPELSAIVMSLMDERGNPVDGFLRLQEVYNLNLSADLVVLSACQTGLGQVIRGEGLIGLTRGFMYAGSPRVVTSLWNVDDAGTAALMSYFYEGMLKDNLAPAAALRQAQRQLWQDPQWRSPYYWAAFTLQGEWR